AAFAASIASRTVAAAPSLSAAVIPVTWNHFAPRKIEGQSNVPGATRETLESLRSYRMPLARGAAPNSRKYSPHRPSSANRTNSSETPASRTRLAIRRPSGLSGSRLTHAAGRPQLHLRQRAAQRPEERRAEHVRREHLHDVRPGLPRGEDLRRRERPGHHELVVPPAQADDVEVHRRRDDELGPGQERGA